jgi:Flp pilus assembly protein TadG
MLVEFALVLMPLIFLTLGSVDIGFILWEQIAVDRAVNAVARCVAVDPCRAKCANIQTYGASLATSIYPVTFTETSPGLAGCGTRISGTLTYSFMILPFANRTLTASACYPRQTRFQC